MLKHTAFPALRASSARFSKLTHLSLKRVTSRSITYLPPASKKPFRFWARPGESALTTLVGGLLLVGTAIIIQDSRDYKVGDVAREYEPKVVGTHRQGTVNRDYERYEAWVKENKKKASSSPVSPKP
ncbi:hypothetical protein QBC44DRAFT_118504 [Cladorrhinum sp. PSN332]|nr:hypothetical protein QBC44DRAFT_118504 [Cladorrhinum sp. PSN332]